MSFLETASACFVGCCSAIITMNLLRATFIDALLERRSNQRNGK